MKPNKYTLMLTVLLSLFVALQPSAVAADSSVIRVDSQPMPQGTKNSATSKLKLYPNPIVSELNILNNDAVVERLMVNNSSTGELIFSSPMPIPTGACVTINMAAYATGYYVVRVWYKGMKNANTHSVYKQ
jgi:hypothetical protein